MGNNDKHPRSRASLNRLIAHGGRCYDRKRNLPRLIAVHPFELDDPDIAERREIVQRLNTALRRERAKARAGTWSYDLNRHIALLQAYKAELGSLGRDTASRRKKRRDDAISAGLQELGFARCRQPPPPGMLE